MLTTAIESDRAGHRYGGRIAPDEEIALFGYGSEDTQLTRAAAWLKSRPGC